MSVEKIESLQDDSQDNNSNINEKENKESKMDMEKESLLTIEKLAMEKLSLAIENTTTYEELISVLKDDNYMCYEHPKYSSKQKIGVPIEPITNKLSIFFETIKDITTIEDLENIIEKICSILHYCPNNSYTIVTEYKNSDIKLIVEKWNDLAKPIVEQMTSLDEVDEFSQKHERTLHNMYKYFFYYIQKSPCEIVMQKWDKLALPIVREMNDKIGLEKFYRKYKHQGYYEDLRTRAMTVVDDKLYHLKGLDKKERIRTYLP